MPKRTKEKKKPLPLEDETINELCNVWYILGLESYELFTGIGHILDAAFASDYFVPEIEPEVAAWRRVIQ